MTNEKDKKTGIAIPGSSLPVPDGAVRIGAKPNSLHARVAAKESGAIGQPGLPTSFKNPLTNFGKIMFFADVSGSMGTSDSYDRNEESKISLLRKAFSSYLDNCVPALNAVGIATFPEQAYEPPTTNHSMIRDLVNQLEATGGTPLAAALNYVEQNEPITHGVIISDGDADEPELSKEIATKFGTKLVKLDTVHIGSSTGGEELLKSIAEITGGIYVKFTDVNAFAKTFQYLSPAKRGLLTQSTNPVALLGAAEVKL